MTELYFGTTDDFDVQEFQNRKVIDEINMTMSAFNCVLPDNAGIYCSSEVTSGRRFYFDLLLPHGVRSDDELKKKLGEQEHKRIKTALIEANVARSLKFTEGLRGRGLVYLVNPGPFFARGFDQQHYLYLWEWVIIEKIYEIFFNEDWQYSNGCTFEFAVAAKKGIPQFDHLGNLMSLRQAIEMVEQAIAELKKHQCLVGTLEHNLALLQGL